MITLFVQGTLLDECDGLIRDLQDSNGWLLLVFVGFVCISAFTVLNMLIGVLCDQIVETSEDEKKKRVLDRVQDTFTEVFRAMDRDSDGVISEEEFQSMQHTQGVQNALLQLGIEPRHLWALQDAIFNDYGAGEKKELSFQKFLDILCHLRPEQKASVLDVADLRMQLRDLRELMEQMLKNLHHDLLKAHLPRPAMKKVSADKERHCVPSVRCLHKDTFQGSSLMSSIKEATTPDLSRSAKALSDIELIDADEDDALPGVPAHR